MTISLPLCDRRTEALSAQMLYMKQDLKRKIVWKPALILPMLGRDHWDWGIR